MKILYSCWTDGIPGLWGSTISTRATHILQGVVGVVNGLTIAGLGEKTPLLTFFLFLGPSPEPSV